MSIVLPTYALTVHQPYATALVRGLKPVENRSWRPWLAIPFQLAIHASRKVVDPSSIPPDLIDDLLGLGDWSDLPRGALVGTVQVVSCRQPLTGERWAMGPLCWVCQDPVEFDQSILDKGKQKIWRIR